MKKPPNLTVVTPRTTPQPPPRKLGEPGAKLWRTIQNEYGISDSGSVEILMQVCLALDRAEELASVIAEDGPTVRTKNGFKAHPTLALELANRSFITRGIQKLGLNLEPVKAVGRPPSWSA